MITFQYLTSSVSLDYTTFDCKICGSQHISCERGKHNLWQLPETITTSKDKDQRWVFHCISCEIKKG